MCFFMEIRKLNTPLLFFCIIGNLYACGKIKVHVPTSGCCLTRESYIHFSGLTNLNLYISRKGH